MESLFVECAVRAALIAVVTAVVLRTIGIKPAAARHTAWTSVMLTMLLLPIWTALGPKTPIRLLPPVEWHGSIETPLQNVLPNSVRLTEMRPVKTSEPHPTGQNWTWQSLLLIVYGFGAFGLLARLADASTQEPGECPGWQRYQFRVHLSYHSGMASSGCDFAQSLAGMAAAATGCSVNTRTRTRSPARSFDPVAGSREPCSFLVPSAFLVVRAETFSTCGGGLRRCRAGARAYATGLF